MLRLVAPPRRSSTAWLRHVSGPCGAESQISRKMAATMPGHADEPVRSLACDRASHPSYHDHARGSQRSHNCPHVLTSGDSDANGSSRGLFRSCNGSATSAALHHPAPAAHIQPHMGLLHGPQHENMHSPVDCRPWRLATLVNPIDHQWVQIRSKVEVSLPSTGCDSSHLELPWKHDAGDVCCQRSNPLRTARWRQDAVLTAQLPSPT